MQDDGTVTVGEAARMLGTTKERIARLIAKGVLTSQPSRLDRRRTLIPRAEVEGILREETYRPPAKTGTRYPQPRPRTAGLYTGPVEIPSDEVEEYLRNQWRAG